MRRNVTIRPFRRGATAVLAMLYLVLFSAMALGFYASSTMSVQISANDERVSRSFIATESGLDFLRFHLARVDMPPTSADPTNELWSDLKSRLESTGNFSGLTIGRSGTVINIPAEANGWVKLNTRGDTLFRAVITDWPQQGKCVTTIYGKYGNTISRAVSMEFTRVPRDTSVFDNAIAAKGQVVVEGGNLVAMDPRQNGIAKMMSAHPAGQPGAAITMTGGTIGGTLTVMDGSTAAITGGSVNGESNLANIIDPDKGNITTANDAPAFPFVDTSPYAAFATNVYENTHDTQKNVRIPRGSGTAASPLRSRATRRSRASCTSSRPTSWTSRARSTSKGSSCSRRARRPPPPTSCCSRVT
jgi:hypothetical protein